MIGNILGGAMGKGPAQGDYESIASTLLSSSTTTVTFDNIPSTYQHLQIRISSIYVSGNDWCNIRVNNDQTANNYAWHLLSGNGSSASASGSTSGSGTTGALCYIGINTQPSSVVIDILDYKDTNKYTTIRSLGGFDANGSGQLALTSTLWESTSAVTRLDFIPGSSFSFASNSRFALYGIKG